MPKPKPLTATQVAERALATAIEFARERGRIQAIADLLSEKTGESITRQMVSRWLHPEPEKRQQPSLGYGLLLLWAVKHLEGDMQSMPANNVCVMVDMTPPEPKRRRK